MIYRVNPKNIAEVWSEAQYVTSVMDKVFEKDALWKSYSRYWIAENPFRVILGSAITYFGASESRMRL